MEDLHAIAALASEYWKLLRMLDQAIDLAPPKTKNRLQAQARYAQSRLHAILDEKDMRIISFEGRTYEPNLAASAINADDFPGENDLIVEMTLEPAVMVDMTVLKTGKVYLMRSSTDVPRD